MFAWRRSALHRRVLVALRTEKTFRGVLYAQRGPLLILKDVELLEHGRDPVRLDGDVVIERPNVDFVQVLPTPEV